MLKLGVLGVKGRGAMASYHAHNPDEGYMVTACCDKYEDTVEFAKEKYGDDVFFSTNIDEFLAQDTDAVFIYTPDFLHEEQALAAINAGKHIYLEKPMTITIEGCDKVLRAAKEKGVKVFVGHNMRYFTVIRKMKQLIDEGYIGELKSVWCRHFISYGGDAYFRDWHSERKYSTGLLLQKGAHDIDVIHWLSGAYSKRVSAFGNLSVYGDLPRRSGDTLDRVDKGWKSENYPATKLSGFSPKIDIEDQTVMIMELDNGVLANYNQCHFTPDSSRNYTFIGTEGRIENYGTNPETSQVMLWNKRNAAGHRIIGDAVFYGDPVDTSSGHGGSDGLIMKEFLSYIKGDIKETVATPQAARMSVAAGYQATMSLRNGGGALDVPPLDAELMNHKF